MAGPTKQEKAQAKATAAAKTAPLTKQDLSGTYHYGWGGSLGGLAGVYGADYLRGHHHNHGARHSMWAGGGYFLGYLLYTWMRNMQDTPATPFMKGVSPASAYHVASFDGVVMNVPVVFGAAKPYEVTEADMAGLIGLLGGSWYSGHLSLYSFLTTAAGAEFGKMLGTYGTAQIFQAK